MRKSKNNKKTNVEMESQVTELMVEDLDNSSEITQEEGIDVENTEKVLEEVTEVEETVTEAVDEVVAEAAEVEETPVEEVQEEIVETEIAEVLEEAEAVAEEATEDVEVAEEVISEVLDEEETVAETTEETTGEVAEEAVEEVAEPVEKKAKAKKSIKMPAFLSKIRIKISHKLLALCMAPMVIIAIAITIMSVQALKKGVEQEIQKSLKIVATSVNTTYTNLYEGDYKQDKGGNVTKGEQLLTGNFELIDALKEQTGFDVSFVFADQYGSGRRVITTLRDVMNRRVVGINLDNEYYKNIIASDTLYVDDYVHNDETYYMYYMRLAGADGSYIGAIEAAVPATTVEELIKSQVLKLVLIAVIMIAVAGVLVIILSKAMATTMGAIHKFLNKLVNGELDAEPDQKQLARNDELGDIYRISNNLQETLIKIVTDIKQSSDNLMDSANNLTQMSDDTKNTMDGVVGAVDGISQGAMTQAESSATANENIVRISEQIDHITQEVENLTIYAQKMNEDEKASEKIIEELNVSSEETKESIDKVAEQIDIMAKSIKQVQKAVAMIQSIADETDLLSLNARIEAARAGESGRGFTVVAEQICKLADQSNKSATEIEKIINGFMATSQKMVVIMNEVRMNMNHQQDKLEETKEKYIDVSKGVENSLTNIESIKEKMGVLSESRDVVRDIVEDLAAISQENAASSQCTMDAAQGMTATMEQLQDASEKLLELSDTLKEGLVIFKI